MAVKQPYVSRETFRLAASDLTYFPSGFRFALKGDGSLSVIVKNFKED